MKDKTIAEQRAYIKKELSFFDLSLTQIDVQRLEKDEDPELISNYLDYYLVPLISNLYIERHRWNDKESIQFSHLLELDFRGHLYQSTLDNVWSDFDEEERLDYSSKTYYGYYPLGIAACNGNLRGIQKLERIYQRTLFRYPDYISVVHYALRQALLDMPKELDIQKHQELFECLLTMCEAFSTSIDSKSAYTGILNKQHNYKMMGTLHADYTKTTPLVNVFSELCLSYLAEKNTFALKKISQYLSSELTLKEFDQFRENLLDLLGDKNSQEFLNCLDALKHQDELMNTSPKIESLEPVSYTKINNVQTLHRIVTTLIENIEGKKAGRETWFDNNTEAKVAKLTTIANWLSKQDDLDIPRQQTLLALVRDVCAIKRNSWGLFKPHSLSEFTTLLAENNLQATDKISFNSSELSRLESTARGNQLIEEWTNEAQVFVM